MSESTCLASSTLAWLRTSAMTPSVCTGPPRYSGSDRPLAPSISLDSRDTGILVCRLRINPTVPSSSLCSTSRMTVWAKFGSARLRRATSSFPAASSLAKSPACRGTSSRRRTAGAAEAARATTAVTNKRRVATGPNSARRTMAPIVSLFWRPDRLLLGGRHPYIMKGHCGSTISLQAHGCRAIEIGPPVRWNPHLVRIEAAPQRECVVVARTYIIEREGPTVEERNHDEWPEPQLFLLRHQHHEPAVPVLHRAAQASTARPQHHPKRHHSRYDLKLIQRDIPFAQPHRFEVVAARHPPRQDDQPVSPGIDALKKDAALAELGMRTLTLSIHRCQDGLALAGVSRLPIEFDLARDRDRWCQ